LRIPFGPRSCTWSSGVHVTQHTKSSRSVSDRNTAKYPTLRVGGCAAVSVGHIVLYLPFPVCDSVKNRLERSCAVVLRWLVGGAKRIDATRSAMALENAGYDGASVCMRLVARGSTYRMSDCGDSTRSW
jgi:hypothetical protein